MIGCYGVTYRASQHKESDIKGTYYNLYVSDIGAIYDSNYDGCPNIPSAQYDICNDGWCR